MALDKQHLEIKRKILGEAREAVANLSRQVNEAGVESSFKEGTYHHAIAYGIAIPLSFASGYLARVSSVLDNPEVGKQYGFFSFAKRRRARKATQAAEAVMRDLPFDKLEELCSKAGEALSGDVRSSVLHFADGLTNKQGQQQTDEDQRMLAPVIRATEALQAYFAMQEAYELV
jgi:hypothetical protein